MGVSALPALTTAWAARSKRAVRTNLESVLRITSLIALPSGLGIMVLSQGILDLLYICRDRPRKDIMWIYA